MKFTWFTKTNLKEIKLYMDSVEFEYMDAAEEKQKKAMQVQATAPAKALADTATATATATAASASTFIAPSVGGSDSKVQQESSSAGSTQNGGAFPNSYHFLSGFINDLLKVQQPDLASLFQKLGANINHWISIKDRHASTACLLRGICFREGYGTKANFNLAEHFIKMAVIQQNKMAHEALGDTYLNFEAANNLYSPEAGFYFYEKGCKEKLEMGGCSYMMGTAYLTGRDKIAKNLPMGIWLINEAARIGHAPAILECAFNVIVYPLSNDWPKHNFSNQTSGIAHLEHLFEVEQCDYAVEKLIEAYKTMKAHKYHALAEEILNSIKRCQRTNYARNNPISSLIIFMAENLLKMGDIDSALNELQRIVPSFKKVNEICGGTGSLITAAEELAKASPQFSTDAVAFLGRLYERGQYLEEDLQKALVFYALGAAVGNAPCKIGGSRCLVIAFMMTNPDMHNSGKKEILRVEANKWLGIAMRDFPKDPDVLYLIAYYHELVFANQPQMFLQKYEQARNAVSIDAFYKTCVEWGLNNISASQNPSQDLLAIKKTCEDIIQEDEHPKALCRLGEIALLEAGVSPNIGWYLAYQKTNKDAALKTMISMEQASCAAHKLNQENPENAKLPKVTNREAKLKVAAAYFQRAEQFRSCYEARYYLCWLNHIGLGILQNTKESDSLLRSLIESSNKGKFEATFYVAKCYENWLSNADSHSLNTQRWYQTFLRQYTDMMVRQSLVTKAEDGMVIQSTITKEIEHNLTNPCLEIIGKAVEWNTLTIQKYVPLFEAVKLTLARTSTVGLDTLAPLIADYAVEFEEETPKSAAIGTAAAR